MARTVTVLQSWTGPELADIEGTDGVAWISEAELQKRVDAANTELYDILVKNEIHQFETSATVTTVAGTATYALPADHYKTLALDYQWATSRFVSVPELTFADRNRFAPDISADYGARAAGYRIAGANLVLLPTPASVQTYKHYYIPKPTDISAVVTSTTIDGIAGWDELLVLLVAISCYRKEQQSPADLREERDRQLARIAQMSVDRGQVQSIAITHDYDDCGADYTRRRW
jgi:hypothetical protein